MKPMNERVQEVLEQAHVDTRLIRQQEGGDGYHCIDCKRPLDFCKCRAITRTDAALTEAAALTEGK